MMTPDWLKPHLRPSEVVLWTGRPKSGLFTGDFQDVLRAFLMFSLCMVPVILLVILRVLQDGGSWAELLLLTAAIAVILTLYHHFVRKDRALRKSTRFAITDQRALRITAHQPPAFVELGPGIRVSDGQPGALIFQCPDKDAATDRQQIFTTFFRPPALRHARQSGPLTRMVFHSLDTTKTLRTILRGVAGVTA